MNCGNVFNKYLEVVKRGSPRDLGRGRFIPEYPWESVAAPIVEWMGVEASQMETVFPNIGNLTVTVSSPRATCAWQDTPREPPSSEMGEAESFFRNQLCACFGRE